MMFKRNEAIKLKIQFYVAVFPSINSGSFIHFFGNVNKFSVIQNQGSRMVQDTEKARDYYLNHEVTISVVF